MPVNPITRDPRLTLAHQSVNARLLSDAILHAHAVEGFATGQARRLGRQLERDVLQPLLARVAAMDDLAGGPARRLTQTITAVNRVVEVGMRGMASSLRADMHEWAATESQWQTHVMQRALPRIVNWTFAQPAVSTLQAVVEKGAVHGKHLDQWWHDLGRTTARKVEQSIRIGVVAGRTTPEIVSDLRGTKAANYADGVLNATRHHATTVVRTAVNSVSARAREAVFRANKDVVKSVQWVSTMDARTSEICAGLDGSTYPVDSGERPPAHPRCRSTVVPVLGVWEEFGIDPDRIPEGERASMDGAVPARTTYGDWLKGQSPDVQNRVLGAGKAELFRSGRVTIDKFIANGRPLTLAQVINREGLAGNNLTRMRHVAAQQAGAGASRLKAAAAERIAAAYNKLPEAVRTPLRAASDAAKAVANTKAGKATRAVVINAPNAGPLAAQKIAQLSGASPATVQKVMTVGLVGDWGGFLLSPVAPILAAIPPGSIVAAGIGLGNMGRNAVTSALRLWSRITKTPAAFEAARAAAAAKLDARNAAAATRKRKRAAAKAAKTRAANASAQKRADRAAAERAARDERRRRDV